MTKFNVYQIHLTREEYSLVNAKGHGACKKHTYKIDMPIARKAEKLIALVLGAEASGYYSPVCSIEADDLNEVFRIGNIGPEEDIERHPENSMSSISVGDVIVDTSTGNSFVVVLVGFKEFPAVTHVLARMIIDYFLPAVGSASLKPELEMR